MSGQPTGTTPGQRVTVKPVDVLGQLGRPGSGVPFKAPARFPYHPYDRKGTRVNRTWGKRSAPLILLTAGFLTIGSGVASADIDIGPVKVPAEGVNVKVGSNSSGSSEAQKSTSTKSVSTQNEQNSPGVAPQQAPLQVPQQAPSGVLSGNSVDANVNVPATVCGNAVGVLGSASGSCGEGEAPPPEEPPPGEPPTPVPPPPGEEEPPAQPRPVPPPGAAGEEAEELPVTGTNAGSLVALAGALLAAGAACVGATSRRVRFGRR
ncbi:MAG: DUF320 domain-containing protein [Streptosporangiales bacterium]|nr:DUF320 domain-containing protein [Streptosporangiales bacterium]